MSITKILNDELNCKDIYLNNITLKKGSGGVTVNLLSKNVIPDEIKAQIKEKINSAIPPAFRLQKINFQKLYCDNEIAEQSGRQFLKAHYPQLSGALQSAKCKSENGRFVLTLTFEKSVEEYLCGAGAIKHITGLLTDKYKEDFELVTQYIETPTQTPGNVVIYTPPQNDRVIHVSEAAPLCGQEIDEPAIYISDCAPAQNVVLCGNVASISEQISKNKGKPYFNFTLKDFTGELRCLVFPSKANYPKVKQLEQGSEIILRGDVKEDAGGLICMVRHISLCSLPKEFTPVQKPSNPPPEKYITVKPQKLSAAAQIGLFEKSVIPKFLPGKTFVVFDVETTGLNCGFDKITEIGAVKITNGVITHSFETLVNPRIHIRQDTVKLNGIDDETVKDSPAIERVLPDFYKFAYGCILVAHNLEFDYKFIEYEAKRLGYYFYNDSYDTILLARQYLKGLPNYRLETLCKYYGIEIGSHHRAGYDAMATARLFIKLAEYM